jgi:signal transduction histidine kinase
MSTDELRSFPLFDGLSDDQLADLAHAGSEMSIEPGVDLFHEGDYAEDWWVLIDGAIDLLRHVGREDAVVATLDTPGRWAGGFRAWDDQGVYLATGRGAVAGRVLRVPSEALRERAATWFPFAEHLIRGLYVTARSIESTARQRESLVALGGLAAGMAHGINNPAAAATRAIGELEEVSQTLVASVGRLAEGGLSAAQLAALDGLRREIEPRTGSLSPLAMADHEDALTDWLAEHGVERDWMIAPALATAGVDVAWCARAAALLPAEALETGLEWVAATMSVQALLADAKESTRRISDLVGALRSYSQMDRAARQHIDVTEGIESTLAMLSHRLGEKIRIVRDYSPDLPRIDAYPGELNQVWTSLIDNALDAMGSAGTLRITTRPDGGAIVVEIGDTGHGMLPQVAARAFEAFYSTKGVGEGAGLGLDIARRIVVERHGGVIAIDSRPGETILRIRLPERPPR